MLRLTALLNPHNNHIARGGEDREGKKSADDRGMAGTTAPDLKDDEAEVIVEVTIASCVATLTQPLVGSSREGHRRWLRNVMPEPYSPSTLWISLEGLCLQ